MLHPPGVSVYSQFRDARCYAVALGLHDFRQDGSGSGHLAGYLGQPVPYHYCQFFTFTLPILHQLSRKRANSRPRSPRALILAPTRELAIQIGEEFRAYAKHLPLRQTVIYGGVSQKPQVNALARGVEILIATPGRLLDLMGQRQLGLEAVEFLVLDEADRMLDMGFREELEGILDTTE